MEHKERNADRDAPELVFAFKKLIHHHASGKIEPDGGDVARGLPGDDAHIAVAVGGVIQSEDHILGRDVEVDAEDAGVETHQRGDKIEGPADGNHDVQHHAPLLFLQQQTHRQDHTAQDAADDQIQLVLQVEVGVEQTGEKQPDRIVNDQFDLRNAVEPRAKEIDRGKGDNQNLAVGGIQIRPAQRRDRADHIKEHRRAGAEGEKPPPVRIAPVMFEHLHG